MNQGTYIFVCFRILIKQSSRLEVLMFLKIQNVKNCISNPMLWILITIDSNVYPQHRVWKTTNGFRMLSLCQIWTPYQMEQGKENSPLCLFTLV